MVLTAPVPAARRTALWVIPVADLGGVARHVLDVARNGVPGWSVVVLCPDGPLALELDRLGCAVLTGPIGPDAGVATSIRTVRRAVGRLRPQVVHSHLAFADLVVLAATARAGVHTVSTEHGIAGIDGVYHHSGLSERAMLAVHRHRLRRVGSTIAVSRATRSAMVRRWRADGPITVIRNGFDRTGHTARDPRRDRPTVLCLSRLAPEKGLAEALAAFAELRARMPAARLVVAGDGPDRAGLQRRAVDLRLGDSVTFPGYQDSADALAGADVLLALSEWENCSYSILEALGAGVGVVASAVGGNPEMLPTSALVDRRDPVTVADRIQAQAGSPEQRPTLPEDWPDVARMCREIAEVYDRGAAAGAER